MVAFGVKKYVKMPGFFSRGEEGEFIWKKYMVLSTYLVRIKCTWQAGNSWFTVFPDFLLHVVVIFLSHNKTKIVASAFNLVCSRH